MESSIYDRVRGLCEQQRISITRLEADCGFSNSTIKKWKTINNPSVDKVKTIAQYFGVTVDYLLGMTDIPTPMYKPSAEKDADIISLQRARSRMKDNDWQMAMRMLRAGFQDAFQDEDT